MSKRFSALLLLIVVDLSPGVRGLLTQSNNCSFSISSARVNGGIPARLGDLPFQVRLESDDQLCGAVIIDSRWILTAGHCVTVEDGSRDLVPPSSIRAYFGSLNRANRSDGVQVEIDRIVLHPSYNSPNNTKNNYDFALAHLKKSLTWSKAIKPACLVDDCSREVAAGQPTCVVSGWGGDRTSADPSDVLKYGVIPMIDRNNCRKVVANSREPFLVNVTITDEMLCAGYPEGSVDTCMGDSGGPLMCTNNLASGFLLHGITSFGLNFCGTPGYYGVYARVCTVSKWIKAVTTGNATAYHTNMDIETPPPLSTTTEDYWF